MKGKCGVVLDGGFGVCEGRTVADSEINTQRLIAVLELPRDCRFIQYDCIIAT
jgi:hypothetical protein